MTYIKLFLQTKIFIDLVTIQKDHFYQTKQYKSLVESSSVTY